MRPVAGTALHRGLALWLVGGAACTTPNTEPTELRPLTVNVIERIDRPSGLAFAAGRLYAVGDQKAKIYVVTADGAVASDIDLALASGEQDTLEAIAVGNDLAVVAREASGELIHVDLADGSVLGRTVVADALDANSGLEGVLIRPDDQRLFALKEKKPTLLIQLDADGRELSAVQVDVATDLSDVCYLCADQLLAVSQADRMLFRLSLAGEQIDKWQIPVAQAEGLAYDGSQRLYIVDEQSAELSVFEFDAGCH